MDATAPQSELEINLECHDCMMTFNSSAELANHRVKFCVGSDYYDEKKLAAQFRKDAGIRDIEQKLTFAEVKEYLHTREDPAGVGSMTLAEIKERFETNDMALEGMKRELQAKRERDLADQTRQLKVKQQQIRAQKNAEDAEIRALMQELQAQKEEELRARMERERLKKVLHGADLDTLANLEQAKQRELKSLSSERQNLKEREDNLLAEIKELEDDIVSQEMKWQEANKVRIRDRDTETHADRRQKQLERQMQFAQERGVAMARLKSKRAELEAQRGQLESALGKVAEQRAGMPRGRARHKGNDSLDSIMADVQSGEAEARIRQMREKFEADNRETRRALTIAEYAFEDVPESDKVPLSHKAESLLEPSMHARAGTLKPAIEELDRLVAHNNENPAGIGFSRPSSRRRSGASRDGRRPSTRDRPGTRDRPSSRGSLGSRRSKSRPSSALQDTTLEEDRGARVHARRKSALEVLNNVGGGGKGYLDTPAPGEAAPHTTAAAYRPQVATDAAAAPRAQPLQPPPNPYVQPVPPPQATAGTPWGGGYGMHGHVDPRTGLPMAHAAPGVHPAGLHGGMSAMGSPAHAAGMPGMPAVPGMPGVGMGMMPGMMGGMPMMYQQQMMQQQMMQQMMQQQMMQQQMMLEQQRQRTERLREPRKPGRRQRNLDAVNSKLGAYGMPNLQSPKHAGSPYDDDDDVEDDFVGQSASQTGSARADDEVTSQLKAIEALPKDSDVYQMRLQHIKEITKLKHEIERVNQEQMLQKLRREADLDLAEGQAEAEHQAWINKQRRRLKEEKIRQTVERELGVAKEEVVDPAGYVPSEGFSLFFDWVHGLQSTVGTVVAVFCVYEKQDPLSDVGQIGPADCVPVEEGNPRSLNMGVFGARHELADIQPSQDIHILVEIKKVLASVTRSVAWTVINPFGPDRQLRTGKWRVELFKSPVGSGVNGECTDERMKALTPIPGLSLQVQMHVAQKAEAQPSLPDSDEDLADTINEYSSMFAAKSPRRPTESKVNPPTAPSRMSDGVGTQVQGGTPAPSPAPSRRPSVSRHLPRHSTNEQPKRDSVGTVKPPPPVAAVVEEAGVDLDVFVEDLALGVGTKEPLAVRLTVLTEMEVMTDDLGIDFATVSKVVSRASKNEKYVWKQPLNFSELPVDGKTRLLVEIIKATEGKKKDKRPIANLLEAPCLLWTTMKPVDDAFQPGPKSLSMYRSPVDLETSNPTAMDATELRVVIGSESKGTDTPPSPPKGEAESKGGLGFSFGDDGSDDGGDDDESELDGKEDGQAFIEVKNPPPPEALFEDSSGFDVYVDGARFLPDNVMLSKVSMKLMNPSLEMLGAASEQVCLLNSDYRSPEYNLHAEYRLEKYIPSATLVFRVDALESHAMKVQASGYAVLNPFVKLGTGDQPEKANHQEFSLNTGSFQLPLHRDPPAGKLSTHSLDHSKRVPCATLLVRIVPAPLGDNGFSLLSRASVPEEQWQAKGLEIPAEPYSSGTYDSMRALPNPVEKKMYPRRARRRDLTVRELLRKYYQVPNKKFRKPPAPSSEAEELEAWIANRLRGDVTRMLDWGYIAEYYAPSGFQVSVDGIHQAPKGSLCKVIYCLSPPASFYADVVVTDDVEFTREHDWDSPAKFQRYLDGFFSFREVSYSASLSLILDVRELKQTKKGLELKSLGWAPLPVFNRGGERYVAQGAFVVPLLAHLEQAQFKDLLHEMQFGDPLQIIEDEIAKGRKSRIKYLSGHSAVLVKVVDGQLGDEHDVPEDVYSMEYVPPKLHKKYAINAAKIAKDTKILRKQVPKRMEEQEWEVELNKQMAEVTEITHYHF